MADQPELAPIEHVFRRHYRRLVARLTRVFGPQRLDLVEDVVQEALLRAMHTWPFHGTPDDPEAWLGRVARNLALSVIRHGKLAESKADDLRVLAERRMPADVEPDGAVADDSLRMMFTCCHPALPADARVALTLKTLCGFGSREIASALLQKEATIAQRLTRAKAKLQRESVAFEVPGPAEMSSRLDSVLEVIYLVFNEGYRAHRGADLVREDLVCEAIRLAKALTNEREIDRPKVHALLALMLFLGARIGARTGDTGELLTLAEQDRSKWDKTWLGAATTEFGRAIAGDELTPFHVEAAIASLHAAARSYEETDWGRILARYDELVSLSASPIVRLNRAVALAQVDGPESALVELERLESTGVLSAYALLPVTQAHLMWRAGDHARAAAHYRVALELPCTDPERNLLERRLAACERGDAAPRF